MFFTGCAATMVSRYVNNMREVNQPTTALGIRLTQLIIVARADNE